VNPIINLISETHNFCERRKYAFNILPEYLIIIKIFTNIILKVKLEFLRLGILNSFN
jgi:hypothetical protein